MACKYQYVMTRRAQQDIRQTVGYIRNDLGKGIDEGTESVY